MKMKKGRYSIIKCSAIGLVSYVVNAADLTSFASGNKLCKYGDDNYMYQL